MTDSIESLIIGTGFGINLVGTLIALHFENLEAMGVAAFFLGIFSIGFVYILATG